MDRLTGPINFPVYIPTKGRAHNQLTANALLKLGIRPFLVVQDSEVEAYEQHNPECTVIAWPQSYMDDYEKTPELDPHPTTGAAHNYAWDHSREAGFTHHWIMDDNIRFFLVRDKGRRARMANPKALAWNEEFIQKWRNLAGIALAQTQFMRGSTIVLNTRLYCATLYRNDLHEYGIRWRRGLNDDTIVSLDILNTGYWCTAENRVTGIQKMGTSRKSRMSGGMTDFYAQGGFIRKSAELVRLYPQYCRTAVRFNRIHHHVDFSSFRQTLIPIDQKSASITKSSESRQVKKTKKVIESRDLAIGIDLANELLESPQSEIRFPIYIPSKNRAEKVTLPALLDAAVIDYKIVIEPQDFENYSKHHDVQKLLVMDQNNQGIHYVRNFIKEHSTLNNDSFHWQLDDDISAFRFRKNNKNEKVNPRHVINLIESVTTIFSNIGAAAPMYDTFAYSEKKIIKLNKMVASAMLFNNDNNLQFRPMTIEDIDISMQYLTADYCTMVFTKALVTVPTTIEDTGGFGQDARIGRIALQRCENLVKQWGSENFKIIQKPNWNNAYRIAPSRIWSSFTHQPILKKDI